VSSIARPIAMPAMKTMARTASLRIHTVRRRPRDRRRVRRRSSARAAPVDDAIGQGR
jgi:hypothetical protein